VLKAVRDELKSDIASLSLKMDSKFSNIDSKFNSIDARFNAIDAKISALDSKISGIESKINYILALIEEQRAENRTVWDQQNAFLSRQNRLEERVVFLEKNVLVVSDAK